MSYGANNTHADTGFRPGVAGLSYYAGGTMGRAAGSAPALRLGQLAPVANYVLDQNGNWVVSAAPSASDVLQTASEWGQEPSVVPGASNAIAVTGGIILFLLWASRRKK